MAHKKQGKTKKQKTVVDDDVNRIFRGSLQRFTTFAFCSDSCRCYIIPQTLCYYCLTPRAFSLAHQNGPPRTVIYLYMLSDNYSTERRGLVVANAAVLCVSAFQSSKTEYRHGARYPVGRKERGGIVFSSFKGKKNKTKQNIDAHVLKAIGT